MKANEIKDLKPLSSKDVMRIYKISYVSLWKWVKSGCPRHELHKGRRILWIYYQKEINEWLEKDKSRYRQAVAEAGIEAGKRNRRRRDKYFINYPDPPEEEK